MQDGKDFTGCQHIDSLYLIIAEHCVCLSTPSAAICKACGLAPKEEQLLKKLTLYLHHQYKYSSHSSLYISFSTDKENLFNNQSFLSWRSFPLFS